MVRRTFPQVYAFNHRKTGNYWLVSARSKRWGMNERRTFSSKKEALEWARQIESIITQNGAQPQMPKEKLVYANGYEKLVERLAPHGKTPEDAVFDSRGNAIAVQA